MNDREFGLIARQLCGTDDIEAKAIGDILWKIYDECTCEDKENWQTEEIEE